MTDKSWVPTSAELPPRILSSGLSNERQWYEIWEFCQHGTEDLVCPLPSALQQHTNTREDNDITLEGDGVTEPPVSSTTCPGGGGK